MSDIEVTIDNGETAIVSLSVFTGRAGIKLRGDAIEVAYYGPPPRALPVPIRVGKRQMIATERNGNSSPNFTVLTAIDDPDVDE